MTYSFIKPDRGPSPLIDVVQIQTNFSVWGTIFAINHVGMNAAKQGDHTFVVLENQAAGPPLIGDETILFSKNAPAMTGGAQPQLFVKLPVFLPTANDPTPSPSPIAMQLTYNTVNTAGPQYQSFLPGGYILYFGSVSNVSGSTIVNLSPAPTIVLMAIATADKVGSGNLPFQVSTKLISSFQFNIFTNASTPNTIQYWALAKA